MERVSRTASTIWWRSSEGSSSEGVAVIGGAMLAPLLLAQAPPVFSAGVEAVSVDVSVTRKGMV